MKNTSLHRKATERAAIVDLFDKAAPTYGAALRTREQRERLSRLAKEVAEMLDALDGALKVDRERAISLIAEYCGLLEVVVEDLACIRDIDETFGGRGRMVPRIASLAEKLERGLSYLLGMFSVASSGENLSPLNWKLIERDVQKVLGTAQSIGAEGEVAERKLAA